MIRLAVNEIDRVSGRFFLRSFRFRKERSTGLSSRRMQVIPISCRYRMAGEKSFLFEETVWENGEALSCGISVGIEKVEPVRVTYGDIFYYSIPAEYFAVDCVFIADMDWKGTVAWICPKNSSQGMDWKIRK